MKVRKEETDDETSKKVEENLKEGEGDISLP
jgi:hypothetical protein